MARLPLTLRNPPLSPYVNKTLTDIEALYVPECLTTHQVDPDTGRDNKVYSLGWEEQNMWPVYPKGHLSRPAAYGKTPEDGW